jgi:hypothetical protein
MPGWQFPAASQQPEQVLGVQVAVGPQEAARTSRTPVAPSASNAEEVRRDVIMAALVTSQTSARQDGLRRRRGPGRCLRCVGLQCIPSALFHPPLEYFVTLRSLSFVVVFALSSLLFTACGGPEVDDGAAAAGAVAGKTQAVESIEPIAGDEPPASDPGTSDGAVETNGCFIGRCVWTSYAVRHGNCTYIHTEYYKTFFGIATTDLRVEEKLVGCTQD